MDAVFTIAADIRRNLIRISLAGFFEAEDVQRFSERLVGEYARLRGARGSHVTLLDIRGLKIQTQDSVAAFAGVLADPAYQARRIAFVVEAGLARMQLQRAAAGRAGRFFTSVEEAEAWLSIAEEPEERAA